MQNLPYVVRGQRQRVRCEPGREPRDVLGLAAYRRCTRSWWARPRRSGFSGTSFRPTARCPDFAKAGPDAAITKENIAPIQTPILILVGTEDRLLALDHVLHDELVKHGKNVRMEIYEHGYHDFVLGNQGHKRDDLPRGEFLLPGALEALELTIEFVKHIPLQ